MVTKTSNPIHLALMECAKALTPARGDYVLALTHLETTRDGEALAKLKCEAVTVASVAGDEKALGTNEAARSRAFALALATDTDYIAARLAAQQARSKCHLTRACVLNLQDRLAALIAICGGK